MLAESLVEDAKDRRVSIEWAVVNQRLPRFCDNPSLTSPEPHAQAMINVAIATPVADIARFRHRSSHGKARQDQSLRLAPKAGRPPSEHPATSMVNEPSRRGPLLCLPCPMVTQRLFSYSSIHLSAFFTFSSLKVHSLDSLSLS